MQNSLEKNQTVLTSLCDDTGRLSVPALFSLFMDIASEHAQLLGNGIDAFARQDLFWVVVRTKIKIFARPRLMSALTVKTWPEPAGRARCIRYYTLKDGEKTVAEGKNEWAIINTKTGRPQRLDGIYPPELSFCADKVCEEAFSAVNSDFSDAELFAEYIVRSTDIDMGHHMNNAAYIRALFGAFSCEELSCADFKNVEITYKTQCFEGERLKLLKRTTERGTEVAFCHAEGSVAVYVILK